MQELLNKDKNGKADIHLPQTSDKQYRRLAIIVLSIFVAVFIVWGALAPIASSVPASGKVSVSSNHKTIQHLEGGIIAAIHVKDGMHVKKDDVLIEMDTTRAGAELGTIASQYNEYLALESRLRAELENRPLIFPDELTKAKDPQIQNVVIAGQKREYEVRKTQLASQGMVLQQRIDQLKQQQEGLAVLVKSYKEEVREWEELYKEQLVDKIRLRDMMREYTRQATEYARIGVQISEINAQIVSQKQDFLRDTAAQLRDVQTRLGDIRSRLTALKDAVDRTKLKSPVDGTVVGLSVYTEGGVVPAGKPIMDIVPDGESLVIEGKIASSDIIYIHKGLETDIMFPSFSHIKSLDIIKGTVIDVSADSLIDEATHAPYYIVKISVTAAGEAELAKHKLKIVPGMPAEAMIVTGSRSLLGYMMKPFRNFFWNTFNEQ